ncbi:MAG: DUF4390 domain-containing protein [Ferrovum sp.]|nr:DUF4390 domain-containing protein [Ferrovum sp.]NDU88186.1 DUF4390 domain-containing protein [Ferrovum sp.]
MKQAGIQFLEGNGLSLSAEFQIDLTPVLVEAIEHGVPVTFSLDFEVMEPRWYWFNRQVVAWHQERRLSYNPLTRAYRFSIGAIYLNFSSLDEALQALASVSNLVVPTAVPLRKGEHYHVKLHLSLDTDRLPKPFQLDALYSNDWNLTFQTKEWDFSP